MKSCIASKPVQAANFIRQYAARHAAGGRHYNFPRASLDLVRDRAGKHKACGDIVGHWGENEARAVPSLFRASVRRPIQLNEITSLGLIRNNKSTRFRHLAVLPNQILRGDVQASSEPADLQANSAALRSPR